MVEPIARDTGTIARFALERRRFSADVVPHRSSIAPCSTKPRKDEAPDFWSGASTFVSSTPTLLVAATLRRPLAVGEL